MAEPGASTRLIVLGCVRIFQPVHGYFLRRELTSWQVDAWANVHPGSIYGALRSLTRDGVLEEVRTTTATNRPTRTSYRLTPAGEDEFFALLRRGLLELDDPPSFLAALNLSDALPRDEVLRALRARAVMLEGKAAYEESFADEIVAARETPDSASELPRMMAARTRGELDWLRGLVVRLEGGAYSYAGEPAAWEPSAEAIANVMAAGVGRAAVVVDALAEAPGASSPPSGPERRQDA
jgi:DNA-binding PadR family transcriptional regulator